MDPLPTPPAASGRLGRLRRALPRLALALPLLAVPALLAVTAGEVAVPPRAWVLVGAALVFAVLAGTGGSRLRRWLDLPLAAGMGLAAGHLLLAPGLPRGHDTLNHLWGIAAVARELAAGQLLPRWVHGLGLGMPLLQFYGPGGYLVPLVLARAGATPSAALATSLVAYGALAAVAMYAAAARWTGDRRAALVAAAAYAFAPYRLLDSHYRAALGESAALALLPLVFLTGLAALREGGRRRVGVAAVFFALLIVTHPLSALMAALGLAVWGAVELRGRALLGGLGHFAAAWALAAALAGFYTVPLAAELGAVHLSHVAAGAERQSFVNHGLAPGDLWRRRVWSDLRLSEPAGSERDRGGQEMPFYLGLGLLSLVPLAAGARRGRAPLGLLVLLAAAVLLSLRPAAAAASLLAPRLAVLQFPWRFLGLAAFAAAAAAGFAAARLLSVWRQRRWVAFVPGALAALLVLDAAPYTGAADWLPPYAGLVRIRWPGGREPFHPEGRLRYESVPRPYPRRVAGYFLPPPEPGADVSLVCCSFAEYLTPAARRAFSPARDPTALARAGVGLAGWETGPLARLRPRPYAFWRPPGGGRLEPRPARRGAGEIVVALDGRAGTVVVLEQAFPGWRVATPDGWRPARPTRAGLLQAPAAAGRRVVRFRFGSTWDRRAGALLSAAAVLGISLAAGRRRRPRAGRAPRRG